VAHTDSSSVWTLIITPTARARVARHLREIEVLVVFEFFFFVGCAGAAPTVQGLQLRRRAARHLRADARVYEGQAHAEPRRAPDAGGSVCTFVLVQQVK
jgi:hypothetical protein